MSFSYIPLSCKSKRRKNKDVFEPLVKVLFCFLLKIWLQSYPLSDLRMSNNWWVLPFKRHGSNFLFGPVDNSMNDFERIWQNLLANIKPKVSELIYNNWIKQLKPLSATDQSLLLTAPNNFVKNWVLSYYHDLLTQELFAVTNRNYSINIEVAGDGAQEPLIIPESVVVQDVPDKKLPIQFPRDPTVGRLNPKYSFDRFVVGSSNQFAHAAASAAAELPGGHYNPLFIYGGVGLGKTHLLNAIGLKVAEKYPRLRILCCSAEQFMNELIFCLRFEKMDQFRKKYRESCDVFLVDDVQFLIGKERTQDEFFHTFNVLYETQRQIAVTSDKLPKDLDGLEERLRSRFEWGLIADIQPPDLETRIAILKKKADLSKIVMDDDVYMFLATQIRSNVRELEGSLIRLGAYASLDQIKITVDFAKRVLRDMIREKAANCSIESIQRTVADFFHLKPGDLKSPRRLKSISTPRQIAMFLCKKHLNASYPEIGQKFGGKDHSTVIHAVRKIENLCASNDDLKNDIEAIEKTLL